MFRAAMLCVMFKNEHESIWFGYLWKTKWDSNKPHWIMITGNGFITNVAFLSFLFIFFFFSQPTISCWCALLIWRRQLFSFSIQSVRHWYFVVDFIMEFFLLKYIVSIFAKLPWFVRSFASVWFSMFHYGIFALILFRLVSVVDLVSIHKILPSH